MLRMVRSVQLGMVAETAQVVAGASLHLSFSVKNTGDGDDCYRVEVLGLPYGWYDLDAAQVTLAAGARATVRLSLHPPAGSPPAGVAVGVQATSLHDATARDAAIVKLTVVSGEGVLMDVHPAEAAGKRAAFRVTLHNQMPALTAITLAASDRGGRLRYRVDPPGPTVLPAGGESTVTVHVAPLRWGRPPAPLTPRPSTIELRGVMVGREHESDPALLRLVRFTPAPRFAGLRRVPTWTLALPLGLLLLLGVARGHTLAALVAGKKAAAPAVGRPPLAAMRRHAGVHPLVRLAGHADVRASAPAAPHRAAPATLPRTDGPDRREMAPTGAAAHAGTAAPATSSSVQALTWETVGVPPMAPTALINPRRIAFGPQAIDTTSAVQAVHVVNLGPDPLTISGVAVTGPDAGAFTVGDSCAHRSIAVDAACTVGVAFSPIDGGPRSAVLTIVSNAASSPAGVLLRGSGGSGS